MKTLKDLEPVLSKENSERLKGQPVMVNIDKVRELGREACMQIRKDLAEYLHENKDGGLSNMAVASAEEAKIEFIKDFFNVQEPLPVIKEEPVNLMELTTRCKGDGKRQEGGNCEVCGSNHMMTFELVKKGLLQLGREFGEFMDKEFLQQPAPLGDMTQAKAEVVAATKMIDWMRKKFEGMQK